MRSALPVLGVIGGMGPAATVDFLHKLIAQTPAQSDHDHIPTIVWSMPQIPNRTEAIFGRVPSPLPQLRELVWRLKVAGASVLAIPCNTAHYWYDQLRLSCDIEILHIVDAVAAELSARRLESGRVGLLATTGTIRAGIYRTRLRAHGYELVEPRPEELDNLIMPSIALIKAGAIEQARASLIDALHGLRARGAEAVILGCTEIPLAIGPACDVPTVDATASLAAACVSHCLGVEMQAFVP